MKSQKFLPTFKTQKSLKEDLQKEQFFEEVKNKIEQELTPEEHEFLITFILQNKLRDRQPLHENSLYRQRPPSSNRNDQSPLLHIKDDVFRDTKRNNKRIITLDEVFLPVHQQPHLAFTSTVKKKVRPQREHFHTVFAQQENTAPSSPVANSSRQHPKGIHFKIYPIKRVKVPNSKSCTILKNRKVMQVYGNNFLQNIFGKEQCGFPDQFSQRYLLTAPLSQENTVTYERLRARHQDEQDKFRSINSLQFDRCQRRNRTAIKLHTRKY